jgi:hypothetical protein
MDRQLFKTVIKLFEAIIGLVTKELPQKPENLSQIVDILKTDSFFLVEMVRVGDLLIMH